MLLLQITITPVIEWIDTTRLSGRVQSVKSTGQSHQPLPQIVILMPITRRTRNRHQSRYPIHAGGGRSVSVTLHRRWRFVTQAPRDHNRDQRHGRGDLPPPFASLPPPQVSPQRLLTGTKHQCGAIQMRSARRYGTQPIFEFIESARGAWSLALISLCHDGSNRFLRIVSPAS